MNKRGIGLVLGGGGAKGYAHIGALKVLEEKGIKIDYVAGTSIGAIIGALHCVGYTASEIEVIAKTTHFKKLFDLTLPKKGFMKGEKIEEYLRFLFKNKKFSDLKKPLYVISADIVNSQEVVFNKGDLAKAVRASCSIPGIFNPVVYGNRVLVDGGVLNRLPINVLKEKGVKNILAINLDYGGLKDRVYENFKEGSKKVNIPNILEILLNSYIMSDRSHVRNLIEFNKSSLILSPDLRSIKFQDFHRVEEGIKKGEELTRQNLKDIISLTDKKPHIFKRMFSFKEERKF